MLNINDELCDMNECESVAHKNETNLSIDMKYKSIFSRKLKCHTMDLLLMLCMLQRGAKSDRLTTVNRLGTTMEDITHAY